MLCLVMCVLVGSVIVGAAVRGDVFVWLVLWLGWRHGEGRDYLQRGYASVCCWVPVASQCRVGSHTPHRRGRIEGWHR